jgi:hypothetical protein
MVGEWPTLPCGTSFHLQHDINSRGAASYPRFVQKRFGSNSAKLLDIKRSAERSATRTRPCGACSNSKPWSGPTCATTPSTAPTTIPPPYGSPSTFAQDRARNCFWFETVGHRNKLRGTSALASADWLALGFEIIDCPFPEWKFQPGEFVASFGLHPALVVGEKILVQRGVEVIDFPGDHVTIFEEPVVFTLAQERRARLPSVTAVEQFTLPHYLWAKGPRRQNVLNSREL